MSCTSGFVHEAMFLYNRGNTLQSKTTRTFRPICQVAAPGTKSAFLGLHLAVI